MTDETPISSLLDSLAFLLVAFLVVAWLMIPGER